MAAGRVEIGFSGGQVVAVRISEDKAKELRKALDKADGWADIETEDGAVALDLREVVFVRGAPGEHRIGFSG
jgi:hypothetical protein